MQDYQFTPAVGSGNDIIQNTPLKIASVGDRLLGSLIDFAISVFISIALSFVHPALSTIGGIAWWIALAVMTAMTGQTPGKRVMNTKVVKVDTPDPSAGIGFGGAILREIIGKFLSAIIILLGFLWIIFDSKQQGWHDKIASTVVIKLEKQN